LLGGVRLSAFCCGVVGGIITVARWLSSPRWWSSSVVVADRLVDRLADRSLLGGGRHSLVGCRRWSLIAGWSPVVTHWSSLIGGGRLVARSVVVAVAAGVVGGVVGRQSSSLRRHRFATATAFDTWDSRPGSRSLTR